MVNTCAAAAAALACLGVASDDDVLVVCNEEQRSIAGALETSARARARNVTGLSYPTLTRHGEEPPPFVTDAMKKASVILAPTTYSLSHTQARAAATDCGARIATMSGVTEEIFKRSMCVDYRELERAGRRVADALSAASTCRVTTPAGTDVVLDLEGRTAISDDGNLSARSAWGNLPAGEGYIAPHEEVGDGTIVFDGALAGYGLLRQPLRVTLQSGRATSADGEAAAWLLATLDAGGPTGRLIAELGIGTNPAAILTGNICEDEKVIGTAHLAFGMSVSVGGTNVASVHLDGMMLKPTVELDGRLLIEDGQLRREG